MRILMLTQWFDPEPAFKGLAFARKLVERGHQVQVLTGFPNYPEGRLYPGYRIRPWQRERLDGIPIVRVPLYPSHDRSAVRRAWNYASFAIAATVLGPALVGRPDVIYAYHPPGTVGMPALALGRWFRAPVVYDVNDLWPDTIFSTGMLSGGLARRLLDRFCGFLYRHADRVTVVTPGFRRTLIERGVNADRVHVIYNWAPGEPALGEPALGEPALGEPALSEPASGEPALGEPALGALDKPAGPAPPFSAAREERFSVVHAGNMGLAQGLDAVLEAARLCAAAVPQARFVFLGDGVDARRLKRQAAEMHLANVEFLPRQSFAAANAILATADVLLAHLKDDPLFAITIPSKTQSYLAAGRPILMAVHGEAAALVATAGAGVSAEPGNPGSIAEAVRRLAAMPAEERARMGRAGREFYEKELSRDRACQCFEEVFQRAAAQPALPLSKRLFDLAVAAPALLLLSPLMALIALAIRLTMGSPVLFRQVRPGWMERSFQILKFRTMGDARSPDGRPLPDADRLTGLGRFLRSTSLDELPQLWNVWKGEMSVVGPRPLLPDYLPRYSERQRRRHEVKPGITGWTQIQGRNTLPWEQKFDLDVWYVDHRSLWLDGKILAATLWRVIGRKGISRPGHATMPEFLGTPVQEPPR